MAYRDTKQSSSWLGIIVLIAFLIMLTIWFTNPFGDFKNARPTVEAVQSANSATAPQGPAVPVTLPTT